jgi:hypothetical protein
LKLESKLWDWALTANFATVWIVTHKEPDFDALCAVTLVESLLSEGPAFPVGASPTAEDRWDWYQPALWRVPKEHSWRYQLAAIASLTDQCRPFDLPRTRLLPNFLYACKKRDADLTSPEFRRKFFGVVRREMQGGRNALTDSVLEQAPEFALERELLDRQDELYARDLRRARARLLQIPFDSQFAESFADLQNVPFIRADGSVDPAHRQSHSEFRVVDGLFIKDPQCSLFKQFARQDLINSPSGKGFVFTAIAYSRKKESPVNHVDYYFSLDPEAIPGAHLYSVWALLQEHEINARPGNAPEFPPRRDFAGRASGPAVSAFSDPWYDGNAYQATIVVTPAFGTRIGPAGERDDLADDSIVRLVESFFDHRLWSGAQEIHDFACTCKPDKSESQVQTSQVLDAPRLLVDAHYRFAAVALAPQVRIHESGLNREIARRVWRTLAPGQSGYPSDFEQRHIVSSELAVGCWNRHGIAVAYLDTPDGRTVRDKLRQVLQDMARVGSFIHAVTTDQNQLSPDELYQRLHDVATLKWAVSQSDAKLAQRFFDAIGFERELSLVYDLYNAEISRKASEKSSVSLASMARLQRSASLIEIFIVVAYATEIAHIVSGSEAHHVFFLPTLGFLILAPLLLGYVVWTMHHGQVAPDAPADHSREGGESAHFRKVVMAYLLLIIVGVVLAIGAHRPKEKPAHPIDASVIQELIQQQDKQRSADWEARWRELLDRLPSSPSNARPNGQ